MKSANKGAPTPAEPIERRTKPTGTPGSHSTRRTQDREGVSQAAYRIRLFVQREPRERLAPLFHPITVDTLCWAFFELKKNASAGADGLTWRVYEEGKEVLGRRMHDDPMAAPKRLGKVVDGWLNYYAVSTSSQCRNRFVVRLRRTWLSILRRRSQKDPFEWTSIKGPTAGYWPRLKVRRPWPEQPLAVSPTQGRSRMP